MAPPIVMTASRTTSTLFWGFAVVCSLLQVAVMAESNLFTGTILEGCTTDTPGAYASNEEGNVVDALACPTGFTQHTARQYTVEGCGLSAGVAVIVSSTGCMCKLGCSCTIPAVDDDTCLQRKPGWSNHTCANSEQYCAEFASDMECCGVTCASQKDNDSCLQGKAGWGNDYTCATSSQWCTGAYASDVQHCCPVTCEGKLGVEYFALFGARTTGVGDCETDQDCSTKLAPYQGKVVRIIEAAFSIYLSARGDEAKEIADQNSACGYPNATLRSRLLGEKTPTVANAEEHAALDSTLHSVQQPKWPSPPGHQDFLNRGRLMELLEEQFNKVSMPGRACVSGMDLIAAGAVLPENVEHTAGKTQACWDFGVMATLGLQDYGFNNSLEQGVVKAAYTKSANKLNCCTVSIGQELMPLGTIKYSGWEDGNLTGTIDNKQPSCTDGKRPVMWNEEATQAEPFPCTLPDRFSNTEFAHLVRVQPCFSQFPFCAVIKVTASADALSVNGWGEVWPADGTLDQTDLDFAACARLKVELRSNEEEMWDPFSGLVNDDGDGRCTCEGRLDQDRKREEKLRQCRERCKAKETSLAKENCNERCDDHKQYVKPGQVQPKSSQYMEQTLGASRRKGKLQDPNLGLAAGLAPGLDVPKCRAKEAGLNISTLADGIIRKAVAKLRFEVMMGPNYAAPAPTQAPAGSVMASYSSAGSIMASYSSAGSIMASYSSAGTTALTTRAPMGPNYAAPAPTQAPTTALTTRAPIQAPTPTMVPTKEPGQTDLRKEEEQEEEEK